jgi:DNA-binding response OmpR family regulator
MAKILVIDDDAAIVDLLKMRLAEDGHEIFAAMDASGGVMMAARVKPDVITLDFQMPAGDGGTTHQRIRGNSFTLKVPIIFITGRDPSDLPPGLRADPNARFVQKPIDMDALKSMIKQLLGGPATPPPSAPPPLELSPEPKEPSTDGGALGGDILDLNI